MPEWLSSMLVAVGIMVGLTILHEAMMRVFRTRRFGIVIRLIILTLFVRMFLGSLTSPELLGPEHGHAHEAVRWTKSQESGLYSVCRFT